MSEQQGSPTRYDRARRRFADHPVGAGCLVLVGTLAVVAMVLGAGASLKGLLPTRAEGDLVLSQFELSPHSFYGLPCDDTVFAEVGVTRERGALEITARPQVHADYDSNPPAQRLGNRAAVAEVRRTVNAYLRDSSHLSSGSASDVAIDWPPSDYRGSGEPDAVSFYVPDIRHQVLRSRIAGDTLLASDVIPLRCIEQFYDSLVTLATLPRRSAEASSDRLNPIFDVTVTNRGQGTAVLSGVEIAVVDFAPSQGDAGEGLGGGVIEVSHRYDFDLTTLHAQQRRHARFPIVPLSPPLEIAPNTPVRFEIAFNASSDIETFYTLRVRFISSNANSLAAHLVSVRF